tara:strand:+ start:8878 stop:9708 length:831 start_codon:yes stop_codon:yes gene_type:complete
MKTKTTPWCPLDAEWWPAIAESIPKPWPSEAVFMDLRWWEDQESMGRAKMPSRRRLQKRWGLSEYRTRAAMRDVLSWSKTQTHPKHTPNTSQSHPKNTTQTPKTARGKTPNTSQTPPNKTPNTSTGAEIQTTNNRQQTTDKTNKADSYSEVRKLWSDLNQIRSDLDSEAVPIKLTSTRKRTLKARLKENPPSDILAVFKWWLQSPHKRAKYLRDNDYGVSTVLKADNFESYLELSRQPSKPKRARLSRNGTLLSSAASSTKDPHKAWSERHQRAAK